MLCWLRVFLPCSSWMLLHSRPGWELMFALGPARRLVPTLSHGVLYTTSGLLGPNTCGSLGPC